MIFKLMMITFMDLQINIKISSNKERKKFKPLVKLIQMWSEFKIDLI